MNKKSLGGGLTPIQGFLWSSRRLGNGSINLEQTRRCQQTDAQPRVISTINPLPSENSRHSHDPLESNPGDRHPFSILGNRTYTRASEHVQSESEAVTDLQQKYLELRSQLRGKPPQFSRLEEGQRDSDKAAKTMSKDSEAPIEKVESRSAVNTVRKIITTKRLIRNILSGNNKRLIRNMLSGKNTRIVRKVGTGSKDTTNARNSRISYHIVRRSARTRMSYVTPALGRPRKYLPLQSGRENQCMKAKELTISAIETPGLSVPSLSYGLERVLFNPGVYHLQDPRSRVFNFDPYLQTIMPVEEFKFSALKRFTTSSNDKNLIRLAKAYGKRYVGSSSSMSRVLCHFHYLLSQWREIDARMLSRDFPVEKHPSFTKMNESPSAIFLRWREGTYAIDADREFDSANILSALGQSMEKLLTSNTKDFERYRKSNPDQVSSEENSKGQGNHYSTIGDLLMRSQLDAHDARLPGTGMFDLKTRSVVSVRMDVRNYKLGVGYQIKSPRGKWESYEREYYDMIRSAFLKYSLQVRMGRMDGIFVAYHNIERIFGFQYIPLPDLDKSLHGTYDPTIGDQEFKMSLHLFTKILNMATKKYPERSLRIHTQTQHTTPPFMYVFAEPMSEAKVQEIQSKNAAKIDEFERNILGLMGGAPSEENVQDNEIKRADNGASVQEVMNQDELPPLAGVQNESHDVRHEEVLAIKVVVFNRVNGKYVLRPDRLSSADDWTVEYSLTETQDAERAWNLYQSCKRQKKEIMKKAFASSEKGAMSGYVKCLRAMSRTGALWRRAMDKEDEVRPRVVL